MSEGEVCKLLNFKVFLIHLSNKLLFFVHLFICLIYFVCIYIRWCTCAMMSVLTLFVLFFLYLGAGNGGIGGNIKEIW